LNDLVKILGQSWCPFAVGLCAGEDLEGLFAEVAWQIVGLRAGEVAQGLPGKKLPPLPYSMQTLH
jgi:hypothetical protein